MSRTWEEEGRAAFPSGEMAVAGCQPDCGMSLRDWFAGQALVSCLIERYATNDVAKSAYEIADAMLEERKK